jgi:hypothetical protein
MLEQRPEPTETDDVPRVEYLLGVLRSLSQQGPPQVLRERLELLASERLRSGAKAGPRLRSPFRSWRRPAFAAALLILFGTVVALVAHVHRPEPMRAGIERPAASQSKEPFISGALLEVPAAAVKPSRIRHGLPRLAGNTIARRMVVRLPYSNSAINTGTDATLRVSMSQAELALLGFPMNGTLHDRRVVADLTLGDDGLPRAISVALPLELVREKK